MVGLFALVAEHSGDVLTKQQSNENSTLNLRMLFHSIKRKYFGIKITIKLIKRFLYSEIQFYTAREMETAS